MTGLLQDLRYAFRQLRKNPGFAAVTVLTLALGIGVNAAMFAVIDAVLLRPLPFPKPDQIVQMTESRSEDLGGRLPASRLCPDMRDWRAQNHSFQDIGWYTEGVRSVDVPGFSDFIPVIASSANLFSILQVQPALGRSFLPEDDQPGHGDGILLNDRRLGEIFWQASRRDWPIAEAGRQGLYRHRSHAPGIGIPRGGRVVPQCGSRWLRLRNMNRAIRAL